VTVADRLGRTLPGALPVPEPQAAALLAHGDRGVARGVVNFLTAIGLFIGQPPAFFEFLHDLAEDADEARRGR